MRQIQASCLILLLSCVASLQVGPLQPPYGRFQARGVEKGRIVGSWGHALPATAHAAPEEPRVRGRTVPHRMSSNRAPPRISLVRSALLRSIPFRGPVSGSAGSPTAKREAAAGIGNGDATVRHCGAGQSASPHTTTGRWRTWLAPRAAAAVVAAGFWCIWRFDARSLMVLHHHRHEAGEDQQKRQHNRLDNNTLLLERVMQKASRGALHARPGPSDKRADQVMVTAPEPSVIVSSAGMFSTEVWMWFVYKLQLFLIAPLFPTKVSAMVAVSVLLVLLGGQVYGVVARQKKRSAAFKAFSLLNNTPGASSVDEETPSAVIVANVLYLVGLFTFSIFLGVMAEEIRLATNKVQAGNFRIVDRDHTLILNWSEKTIPILRQMVVAKKDGRPYLDRPVVILANKDKTKMDIAIAKGLNGGAHKQGLTIITRSGYPARVEDLDMVAAGKAKRVIILKHAGERKEGPEDPEKTRTDFLVTQKAVESVQRDQRRKLSLFRQAHDALPLTVVHASEAILGANDEHRLLPRDAHHVIGAKENAVVARIVGQCVLQPGVSGVHEEILTQTCGSVEFYFVPLRKWPMFSEHRLTYGDITSRFDTAVVCGVMGRPRPSSDPSTNVAAAAPKSPKEGASVTSRPDTPFRLLMNPPPDLKLEEGDRLLFLANCMSKIRPRAALPAHGKRGVQQGVQQKFQTQRRQLDEQRQEQEAGGKKKRWGQWGSSSSSSSSRKGRRRRGQSEDAMPSAVIQQQQLVIQPQQGEAGREVLGRHGKQKKKKKKKSKQEKKREEEEKEGGRSFASASAQAQDTVYIKRPKHKTVVLNWTPSMERLLPELDVAGAFFESLEVNVLVHPSCIKPFNEHLRATKLHHLKVNTIEGSMYRMKDLHAAGVHEANSVVVLQRKDGLLWLEGDGDSDMSNSNAADNSGVLTTIALMQEVIGRSRRSTPDAELMPPPTLVAELHTKRVATLAQQLVDSTEGWAWGVCDIFVPDALESGSLVQISLDHKLASVYEEVFRPNGWEVLLSDTQSYGYGTHGPPTEAQKKQQPHHLEVQRQMVTFGDICDRAQNRGHVAIGMERPLPTRTRKGRISSSSSSSSADGGGQEQEKGSDNGRREVLLNPPKNMRFDVNDVGVRVIVLAKVDKWEGSVAKLDGWRKEQAALAAADYMQVRKMEKALSEGRRATVEDIA